MIFVHTPQHPMHDYLFIVYFDSLRKYAADHGIPISTCTDLRSIRNCTVLVDAEYLDDSTVADLKANGVRIVGFNMVDSSYVAAPCRSNLESIDLIFMLTGIQTTNIGHEVEFDDHFHPVLVEKQFLPEHEWSVFNMMRLTGRMHSLPYVHWEKQPEPGHLPFQQKNGKVLIRGGAHFRRVALAFFLMQEGLLDPNSGFAMKQFFGDRMNTAFQFCDECRSRFHRNGDRYQYHVSAHSSQCSSPAEWGGELKLSNVGSWNNRCPRSFYWLADQFEQHNGQLPNGAVEQLFNADFVNEREHQAILQQSSFTADLKWLHSIYVAQRFWDAAICGTVNLLPYRTIDQEFFPVLNQNEHFIPFPENMTGLDHDLSESFHNYITNNCWALYTEWIRPTDYRINTNLIRHIFDIIGI